MQVEKNACEIEKIFATIFLLRSRFFAYRFEILFAVKKSCAFNAKLSLILKKNKNFRKGGVFMQKHPFTISQMFRLKQKTLEKRITAYYQTSSDAATVIKLVRLLQIRGELSTEAIDTPCFELIRTLYIQQPGRKMKRYFFYFQAYFS